MREPRKKKRPTKLDQDRAVLRLLAIGRRLALFFTLLFAMGAAAQVNDDPFQLDERLLNMKFEKDSTISINSKDSIISINSKLSTISSDSTLSSDSLSSKKSKKSPKDWSAWRPDVKRAMWLALVFPGAGQIYNRKYWKLPIIYGGFVGCIYAYSWNNQMYKDYAQAYMDMMDDDPTTKSYEQMHLGSQINESNMARYQKLFKQRKDRFRRYRDMSTFCIIGVYALSVIDAYVDASLSEFDISDDLTLRIAPTYINDKQKNYLSPYTNSGWGLTCSINF